MKLIDSHCHLDFSEFDLCRDDVLQRAWRSGVSAIVVPGVQEKYWSRLLALTSSDSRLHPALGLHPIFLDEHASHHLDELDGLLAEGKACAVGEIGLDLYLPNSDLNAQLAFFLPQLELAQRYDLPVILHVRKAHDQVLKALRRHALSRGGIVHAFSGSEQQARHFLDLGFKLGVGGTITYPRARKIRRMVVDLPLDAFVLETDAPDMPLSGYQGVLNEPVRILEVAKVMAELRGCSLEEVAAVTNDNSLAIYEPPE